MSYTREKRTRIKTYMMEKIFIGDSSFIEKTVKTFDTSTTTVYKYLQELQESGMLTKDSSGKFALKDSLRKDYEYDLNDRLQEDIIYNDTLRDVVKKLPDNVVRIWEYSFMEMVNNAIDHSIGTKIKIFIRQNALYTWVNIVDDGVGIFNKIAEYYKFNDLDEAILALFKGKFTTDSANHSGEGIFFTSRVMDHFYALSDEKVFSQDNTVEMIRTIEEGKKNENKGTRIILALSNYATQSLREAFNEFSSDNGGFSITKIPMKKICDSGYPVSRSQAKRLYFGFDKFKTIILDFKDVDDIGQGFAHELFVVFRRNNPAIELKCINENENVSRMIAHVLSD